jgi:hypothetical protein
MRNECQVRSCFDLGGMKLFSAIFYSAVAFFATGKSMWGIFK